MHQASKCMILAILIIGVACGKTKKESSDNSDEQDLDHRTEIRLKQYQVKGAQLYAIYCANCHQKDGKGLGQVYPPLARSDYLLDSLERAACIIKNGQSGEISVNGNSYNQMMPANPQLSALEVAEILTFVSNAWDNQTGLSGVKDVERWLMKCE